MVNIDNIYNFDEIWVRGISVALCKTLTRNVRWINRFSEGVPNGKGLKRRVLCPFYLTIPGDERFVLDAWVDDIRGERIELNTDQIPRAVVQINSATPVSSEFANPNQYLSKQSHINSEIRNIISKVKAVPIQLSYNIEIKLSSEGDSYKAWQKIIDTLFNYQFFRVDYFGMAIDAVMVLPDNQTIEIPREIDMGSDTNKLLKFSLDVKSYYPIFQINVDDLEVCDNDDELDWNRLGVPKPTDKYFDTLRSYLKNYGQVDSAGIQKVFWKNYFYKLTIPEEDSQAAQYKTGDANPRTWDKYNL
jgi:hypothetical protein